MSDEDEEGEKDATTARMTTTTCTRYGLVRGVWGVLQHGADFLPALWHVRTRQMSGVMVRTSARLC